MGLEGMDWIDLAQDKYNWVYVSTITNLLLAKMQKNFMTEEPLASQEKLCSVEFSGRLFRYLVTAVGMMTHI
jgi:hypothetical protein